MKNITDINSKVLEALKIIESSNDDMQINAIVENVIKDITDAEYASVWVYNDQNLVRYRDSYDIASISMAEKQGLLYQCFVKKEAGIYNYLTSAKGYVASIDNPDNIRIKSKIMIPVVDGDRFLGIVTAYSTIKKIKKFTNEDLEVCKAILPFIKKSFYIREMGAIAKSHTSKETSVISENLQEFKESRLEEHPSEDVLSYVSNIVHDIRTPANGLLGFLDILQDQIKDERLKEYVAHARDSASLINDLTTSILDGVVADKEPTIVNTSKYFSKIADMFSANMAKKSISYNIFIDPFLPKEIELDSMKIKRVIMNLIGNASKFTPENGCIEFSVRYKQKEKKLHIFVKDNGIGIAKEKQAEIFEAFKQAEENTKDEYGGTGLGLAICAAYVKEIGGKLLIDSELDEGSVFYFDLPMEITDYAKKFTPLQNKNINITLLCQKENHCSANHIARYLVKMGMEVDSIKAVTSMDQIPQNTTHLIAFEKNLNGDLFIHVKNNNLKFLVIEENFLSLDIENLDGAKLVSKYSDMGETLYSFCNEKKIPKVLIVEDDNITITLLKAILRDEYCEVDIAHNGADGLEALQYALQSGTPYDIVYTDQNMPVMSGEEMIKRYSEMSQGAKSKISVVSISGEKLTTSNQGLFDVFANKPFKKTEILEAFFNATKK
jgi:signal transduction histidine kinase/ActR/RegA family two-component response regulator